MAIYQLLADGNPVDEVCYNWLDGNISMVSTLVVPLVIADGIFSSSRLRKYMATFRLENTSLRRTCLTMPPFVNQPIMS